VGSGLSTPAGLTIDAAGDLFVADQGNNRVEEITPAGVQSMVAATDLLLPTDVAVDAANDVYIIDTGNNRIVEVRPDGSQTTLGTGIVAPQAVALDAASNLYVVNDGEEGDLAGEVLELLRSQPPALSFPSTLVGATSTPQSIQFENVGNQPLSGTGVLSDIADFIQVPGSGPVSDCTPNLSLAPGAECNLSITFTPQSRAPLSATITISDNVLNNPLSKQIIGLSGVGLTPPVAQVSATVFQFGTIAFGSTASQPSPLPIPEDRR